jgi:FAD/FMN-containing dehydrogenase
MHITATRQEQLAASLAQVANASERIESIDLRPLNRIIEHTPEDLTVSVEAGLTLAELQAHLAKRGQWLPVDPPGPERISIWDLLKFNLSGPRRYGYGTIREHLIGLKVALADGRLIRSGGKVVKNVAGYDLLKLFVGDQGTLGVVVEATFKVQPLPERERFVQRACSSLAEAGQVIEAVIESPLTPQVLDLHDDGAFRVVIGLAGTGEEVGWSVEEAAKLGIKDAARLDYDQEFQEGRQQLSVLPSRLIETIERLEFARFVCRAGNGIIYHHRSATLAEPALSRDAATSALTQRIKDTFDPKHVLPAL